MGSVQAQPIGLIYSNEIIDIKIHQLKFVKIAKLIAFKPCTYMYYNREKDIGLLFISFKHVDF